MKLWRINFLVKSNSRRNKKSGSVFLLLLLSVFALTLIMSFTATLNRALDGFKNQDPARRLSINTTFVDLGMQILTPELIGEIGRLEHVVSVDMDDGMDYQFFKINKVTDDNGDCTGMLPVPPEDTSIETWALYKTQKMDVVAGRRLDESPVFSCIVPDSFCPVDDYDIESGEKDGYMQNGLDYLGKTLTVEVDGKSFEILEYKESGGVYLMQWDFLPALEYKFRVVGVYHASYEGGGNPRTVYVSNETANQIERMAVDATKSEIYIEEYYDALKRTDLHSFTVLVDRAENVEKVREQLEDMKISVSTSTEHFVPDDVGLFANVFIAAGNFFTVAVLLLTVINLFLSTSNSLLGRKAEIGLLKAIGYKNRQVFWCLYLEQAALGLRAFVIGGGISALAVFVINLINANGAFVNRIYVVSWWDFLALCAAALLLTIIVPLLCELTLLHSMMKISPRQAMAAQ
ncbi:MAG: ABC transporter permease [Christensenellales bacterium]